MLHFHSNTNHITVKFGNEQACTMYQVHVTTTGRTQVTHFKNKLETAALNDAEFASDPTKSSWQRI